MTKQKSQHPLVAELEAYHTVFQERAKIALREEFKSFFEKFPEVESVRWSQYTPYFNDGEPCEFGVNELTIHALVDRVGTVRNPEIKVVSALEPDVTLILENAEEDGKFAHDIMAAVQEATYSWRTRTQLRPKTEREVELENARWQLGSLVHGLGDMMKNIFEDHSIIIATRNGFDIEQYDHE